MGGKAVWAMVALGIASLAAFVWSRGMFGVSSTTEQARISRNKKPAGAPPEGSQTATFGTGCFWCTEAIFQQLKGVHAAVSGYSGGNVANPSYQQVCSGNTGHAEVIRITYDPTVISYAELLEVFFRTHDPTTKDRQGNDFGTQYRSVIFYHTEEQRELAEQAKKDLDASGAFDAPIVTEISPFANFYAAEDYHQNYYSAHPDQGYCRSVIVPKLDKFEKVFKDKLKPMPQP